MTTKLFPGSAAVTIDNRSNIDNMAPGCPATQVSAGGGGRTLSMTTLKTKESTLRALRMASRRELTADELQRQRVSFIMGSLKSRNVTREKVEELLAKQEGRKGHQ
jgi:hypothetical protein